MSFGCEHQRTGQADALALASGELVRVQVGRLGLQADLGQHVRDAPVLLGVGPDALDAEGLADDGPHPHPGVERGVRVLEHELQLPPALAQLGRP